MPLKIDENLPTPGSFPKPDFLTLQNFKRGVITLANEGRIPKNALKEAVNLFLVEDGQPSIRPGVNWYGTSPITTTATIATPPTVASGTNWTTPGNVYASDNSRAVYANTAQNDLAVAGFGFAIPTGATILGVTVTVEGNGTDATAANRSIEVGITKNGGVTLSGTRAAAQNLNQTTDTTLTFGGPSSLFGTTLTVAQVNHNANFGIMLRAGNTNAGARNIDQVTVTITYSYSFEIDGFDYFDFNGAIHLVAVSGGYVHRSTDDAANWTQCAGATLTAGTWTNMNQNGSFLYLTNGVDNMIRYDGSTTLQVYTALTTPAAATAAVTGAGTTYTYFYKISAVNAVGFSTASASVSAQIGTPRSAWDSTTNYITLTLPAYQATQTRYDIYFSEDDINYYYLDSQTTPNLTYKDAGSAVVVPSTLAPTDNTTQGPKYAELTNVGIRQFGVRDPAHRERIGFTGAGNYSGAFSSAYDGGYLDWQPGGKLVPVKVADYRDGKGSPIATVWCDSADGQGAVIQLSLSTLTVGNISITVPSAYTLPGSRGTPAPGSVVNVLNDFFFYNSQAFYNLGSRAQFLNLLSTDEASANIRPNVKQINRAAEADIASVYFDANIYFSIPVNSITNNKTAIYNTEMKAWLPEAFTIGFSKFLRYADQNKEQHLLCLKPGDKRLSEISSSINGDYGQAFETSLITGLYQTTNDRYEFQYVEEAEFEFSSPQGTIFVELLGIDRPRGYRSVKVVQLSSTVTVVNAGWDTFDWDTRPWDDTSVVPSVVSEISTKRYTPIQKELNAVQWHIYSNSIDAHYILRSLQSWGTATQGGHPASWRLKAI